MLGGMKLWGLAPTSTRSLIIKIMDVAGWCHPSTHSHCFMGHSRALTKHLSPGWQFQMCVTLLVKSLWTQHVRCRWLQTCVCVWMSHSVRNWTLTVWGWCRENVAKMSLSKTMILVFCTELSLMPELRVNITVNQTTAVCSNHQMRG